MRLTILAAVVVAGSLGAAAAQRAGSGPVRIPIKEVSIFKDGHAFVLHQGSAPVDPSGNLVLDFLPAPVLGTFWAYSPDKNVRIDAMVAGQHRVVVERAALRLNELLEANVGAEVTITEKPTGSGKDGLSYRATIMAVPHRSDADTQPATGPYAGAAQQVRGELIMLKTAEGVKAMPLDRIQDVTFRSEMKSSVGNEELRNLLTLRFDWNDKKPARNADVGLVYLQKGLRWIPNYRVAIDGKGSANVKLQGTLINELADLQDVTANLIVGVPSFAFKDTLDPLALRQNLALSGYFQTNDRTALSNALMAQSAARAPQNEAAIDLGPAMEGTQNEDLYLFTVKHVTLNKGERLTLPISDNTLRYKDVYALNLPFSPPSEIQTLARGGVSPADQEELARLTAAPRVMHRIRLTNSSSAPITTAPAIILSNETVLGQGMTTYTPAGTTVDLDLTRAVDIQVTRNDTETARTPNAGRIEANPYSRVDLSGSVRLTNLRKDTVEIEITREVLGEAVTANNNAQIQKLNVLESDRPSWWRLYNWPAWWNQLNGVGRITWRITLAPGAAADLNYTWRYFARM